MRRHFTLSFALILGLVAALNTAPLFAMQSEKCLETEEAVGLPLDCDSVFKDGLGITAMPENEVPYRYYDVQFIGDPENPNLPNPELGAYIPELFNPEAMVVEVLSGIFAFRVQTPGVIVALPGPPLERFIADPEIPLGEDPEANAENGRTYSIDGEFSCDLQLRDGRIGCLLNPDDFTSGEVFVRLERGDTVYLPSNSTCFLCNTDRIDPATGQVVEDGVEPAELLIWSSITGFDGELDAAAFAMAAPQQEQLHATRSWMFNPGGRCH